MSTPHPFRFGVVDALHGTAAEVAATARRFEDRGFSTVLVPDTLWTPAPFSALAAAAGGTTTLRLGTWVLSAPLRRPAEVVREATTLQRLSGGRLELGVGAGRPGGDRDAEALGIEWGRPGVRVDRVERTLEAVSAAEGAPPIVIAGSGDRMLRLAARYARTLALAAAPTAGLEEIGAIAGRARAAGPRLELSLQVAAVGDLVPEWQRRQGLTAEAMRDAASALSGELSRDIEALERLRETTGISYLTVPAEFADALAPLVAALTGR